MYIFNIHGFYRVKRYTLGLGTKVPYRDIAILNIQGRKFGVLSKPSLWLQWMPMNGNTISTCTGLREHVGGPLAQLCKFYWLPASFIQLNVEQRKNLLPLCHPYSPPNALWCLQNGMAYFPPWIYKIPWFFFLPLKASEWLDWINLITPTRCGWITFWNMPRHAPY